MNIIIVIGTGAKWITFNPFRAKFNNYIYYFRFQEEHICSFHFSHIFLFGISKVQHTQ